mgnify:CR=1
MTACKNRRVISPRQAYIFRNADANLSMAKPGTLTALSILAGWALKALRKCDEADGII